MSKFAKFSEFLRNKKPTTAGAADDISKGLVGDDHEGPYSEKPENDYEPQDYPDDLGAEDTGFVYKADNDDSEGLSEKPAGRVKPSSSSLGSEPKSKVKTLPKRKLTAEEFVKATEDMTDQEFVKFMSETTDTSVPTITDLYGNEFTPDPNQTISYLCGLLLANERLMTRFVREIKRRDGLENLISETFEHPESYDIAVESMRHDEKGHLICDRLARSMNDQYMTEISKFMFDENVMPSMDDREGWKDAQSSSKGNPAAGGGSNPGPGEYDTPDNTYSQPDLYSAGGEPHGHDIKGGGGGMPGMQQGPDFGSGPVAKPGGKNMREYKGNLAFKNMGESMIKFDDIRKYLRERCVDC